ncbi:MAG: hypothetical protein WA958_03630 [Tunicatimonas sp.]
MKWPLNSSLFLGIGSLLSLMVGCQSASLTKKYPAGGYTTRAAYEQARQTYVQRDSARAFDASVTLSAREKAVDEKLSQLRRRMITQYKRQHFFPPAHYFYESQQEAKQTLLFRILRKMPKGGVLHLHPEAAGNLRWVVDRALKTPQCYVFWQDNHPTLVKGQLDFFKPSMVPKGYYSVWSLNKTVPHFADSLYDLLTFDARMNEPRVDVWREFERCFQRVSRFIRYQPVFRDFTQATFETLAEDGVQHVELRTFLGVGLHDLEHPPGHYTADTLVRYYQEAVERTQQKYPDFTAKLIYTNHRFQPRNVIDRDVEKAFQLRKRYPEWVKGYDLVAEEDRGQPTRYYLDTWLKIDSLEQVYGIDLPLFLHDGESDWASENLYDAVTLGSRRIGHGFNLFLFPSLQEAVRERDIAIELNPLSNQILGYVGDLRVHPARAWLQRGIPCTISPDDPGVFGYEGVTPDYWAIFLAWELDLRAIKQLLINSISYSALSEAEKQTAMQHWQGRWNKFIDYCLELPIETP